MAAAQRALDALAVEGLRIKLLADGIASGYAR
jgi:hypothetical protein